MVIAVAAMLLLHHLHRYLIIYNVFQISVTNDIRFYGLLKTIGTTPRQLRRIIRQQALTLSLAGIPWGWCWVADRRQLTPAIVSQLNGVVPMTSVSPVIFIGAALFSLVTVLLSRRKPGRIAGKVSPIEAVRYTEGGGIKRKTKKAAGRVPAVHGLGQPGPQRADRCHRHVPVSGGGTADSDGELHQRLRHGQVRVLISHPATSLWRTPASSRPAGTSSTLIWASSVRQ
ncbi:MAG: ABC transporter permease [Dysosmobacter welbionis]